MENLKLEFIPIPKIRIEPDGKKIGRLIRISLGGAVGIFWRRFNCLEELTVKSLYAEVV